MSHAVIDNTGVHAVPCTILKAREIASSPDRGVIA